MELEVELPLVSRCHNRNRIYVRFMNLRNRCVDIIWIDNQGNYRNYHLLHYRGCVEVGTFETHPWIAVDSYTKDRMLVDKKFVYKPKILRDHLLNQNPLLPNDAFSGDKNPRLSVAITTPMYSLRDRILLKVRSYLKSDSDVDVLGLPNGLSCELKVLVDERNRILKLENKMQRKFLKTPLPLDYQ